MKELGENKRRNEKRKKELEKKEHMIKTEYQERKRKKNGVKINRSKDESI